jgi:hypothetical protein
MGRTVVRWMCRGGLALVSLLAGCWGGGIKALYGPEPLYGIQPPPHDPSLTIQDFSYTPASPVAQGSQLEFSAKTSKPTDAAYMTVSVGDPRIDFFPLQDNGVAPDAVADDGIWTGQWTLPQNQTGTLPVIVRLEWLDGYRLERQGPDLLINDGEGGTP